MPLPAQRSGKKPRSSVPVKSHRTRPVREIVAPSSNALSLPDLLANVSTQIWDGVQIQSFVASSVERILDHRAVPRSELQPPVMDIAVPAIEAMRYCQFRSELSGLIAVSMDRRHAHLAHPAFVDILRQVTRDELSMLALFPVANEVIATGHLHLVSKSGKAEVLQRNILPAAFARACQSRSSIATYVDNLQRLSLIHTPSNLTIKEHKPYEALLAQPFCEPLMLLASRTKRVRLERGVLGLSDLGQAFRAICLDQV